MKCEDCSGHCCRKFVKFITIQDLARIKQALEIEPLNFAELKSAQIESDYPQIMIYNKPHFLALDTKMAKNDCIFLMEVGNTRKCGIHQVRPRLCQTYPYVLGEEGKLELSRSFVCPRQHWPEGEEKEKYLQALVNFNEEKKEYQKIVDEWNQEHGERGSYLKFMEFALARIKSV